MLAEKDNFENFRPLIEIWHQTSIAETQLQLKRTLFFYPNIILYLPIRFKNYYGWILIGSQRRLLHHAYLDKKFHISSDNVGIIKHLNFIKSQ